MKYKEYIVIMKPGVYWKELHDELTIDTENNPSVNSNIIPTRSVDVANFRDSSEIMTHYFLTEEEADKLKLDSRIQHIELHIDHRENISIGLHRYQTGHFSRVTPDTSTINWGLVKCNQKEYPISSIFHANYDGSNVDVVIQDSGLDVTHPEFLDYNGNSRVQLINWYTINGFPDSQSANFYRDMAGHGTHVAGIVAGLTYGWAKNANIYSMKLSGLEGSGDSGTGISGNDAFDLIRLWHQSKPVNPITGVKNPTVVNMSWGYLSTLNDWNQISAINYRGSNVSNPSNGTVQYNCGIYGSSAGGNAYNFQSQYTPTDIEIQQLIQAGIHVIISSGNDSQKLVATIGSDSDYNNTFTSGSFVCNYHQVGSPHHSGSILVGSIDSFTSYERKADYSNHGPATDIYSPGTLITSSWTKDSSVSGTVLYKSGPHKIRTISGTSMASPQIAGIVALYAQKYPTESPSQIKQRIIDDSIKNSIDTSPSSEYDYNNIGNGNNRYVRNLTDETEGFSHKIILNSNSNLKYN